MTVPRIRLPEEQKTDISLDLLTKAVANMHLDYAFRREADKILFVKGGNEQTEDEIKQLVINCGAVAAGALKDSKNQPISPTIPIPNDPEEKIAHIIKTVRAHFDEWVEKNPNKNNLVTLNKEMSSHHSSRMYAAFLEAANDAKLLPNEYGRQFNMGVRTSVKNKDRNELLYPRSHDNLKKLQKLQDYLADIDKKSENKSKTPPPSPYAASKINWGTLKIGEHKIDVDTLLTDQKAQPVKIELLIALHAARANENLQFLIELRKAENSPPNADPSKDPITKVIQKFVKTKDWSEENPDGMTINITGSTAQSLRAKAFPKDPNDPSGETFLPPKKITIQDCANAITEIRALLGSKIAETENILNKVVPKMEEYNASKAPSAAPPKPAASHN